MTRQAGNNDFPFGENNGSDRIILILLLFAEKSDSVAVLATKSDRSQTPGPPNNQIKPVKSASRKASPYFTGLIKVSISISLIDVLRLAAFFTMFTAVWILYKRNYVNSYRFPRQHKVRDIEFYFTMSTKTIFTVN